MICRRKQRQRLTDNSRLGFEHIKCQVWPSFGNEFDFILGSVTCPETSGATGLMAVSFQLKSLQSPHLRTGSHDPGTIKPARLQIGRRLIHHGHLPAIRKTRVAPRLYHWSPRHQICAPVNRHLHARTRTIGAVKGNLQQGIVLESVDAGTPDVQGTIPNRRQCQQSGHQHHRCDQCQ